MFVDFAQIEKELSKPGYTDSLLNLELFISLIKSKKHEKIYFSFNDWILNIRMSKNRFY